MIRILKPTFTLLASLITVVAFVISSCEDDNNGVIPESKTPTAPTGQVTDITFYTADITGKLELSKDELKQSEFGLLLSTSDDVMAVNSTKYPIKKFDKDYSFTLSLDGLDSVTTYYYRSYIYFEGNYFYSDVQDFTTKSPLDIIQTGNIESDSCTVKTLINSKNLIDHIQQYGISYGLNKLPLVATDSTVTTNAIGSDGRFTLKMRNIPFDTLVNYRAYVRVNNVDYYGPTLQFQGNSLRTGIINISDYTVKSHLKINDGYKEIGVCYGIDSIPVIFDQKVSTTVLNDSNDFKLKLVNIPFDTIVYYRAYALTGDSVYYGNINSFGGNTVTTGIIDTITFQVQSSVKYNDGISEYGVCYSNSEVPVTLDKKVSVQQLDSSGCYTLSLINVPFGTVYYRSYVIKDDIAYYGDIRKFEGNSITTGEFDDESLKAKSIIRFSNSYDNPEIGICYSNNQEPTIANKHVLTTVTDTTCTYDFLLRNMPFGTVYYRAYMMYDGFPVYGEAKQIEGNAITTSTFIDSTFTANSSIRYSRGYDALNLGVCYSNNATPTVNDKVITSNSVDSLNSFAVQLTEIPFGKVYYRSYMMYDGAPQYGEVKCFEGNSITTGSFIDSSLVANANLKFSKGYKELELGICYGTGEQPTINDKKVSTSSVDSLNSFALGLTEIPFGKVYYRSYMMYEGEPQYGEVKSFAGNEITTGIIDSTTFIVKSHVAISRGYNNAQFGVCWGVNETPTVENNIVMTNDVDIDNDYSLTLRLTGESLGKLIYYRAYVTEGGQTHYGSIKSFMRKMPIGELVDLGLSVNWASFNIGAEKPEDFGLYFSWGETETKSSYNWSTYKYCNGSDVTITKYCDNSYYGYNGYVDNYYSLSPEDDVANVKWGDAWRMPTKAEYSELLNNCNWLFVSENGVQGYKVTSKVPGYENQSIFLPAAGYSDSEEPNFEGSWGHYWSKSLYYSNYVEPNFSYCIRFNEALNEVCGSSRNNGFPVRPVVTSLEWISSTELSFSNEKVTLLLNKTYQESPLVKHNDLIMPFETTDFLWSSDNPTVASVDRTGKIIAKSKGSANITASISSLSTKYTVVVVENESEIEHEYVDLGLSVSWASFNVGSITEEDFGDYFAWGETEIKDDYSWSTYKYSNGNSFSLTKYNWSVNNGTVDNKSILDIDDDVAQSKWGGYWRMPTEDDLQELINNCDWEWITINGINGYKISSKISGFENSHIFLPVAGDKSGTSIYSENSDGGYWSSTLYTNGSDGAKGLQIDSNSRGIYVFSRHTGYSVRPVCHSEAWLASTTIELSESTRTIIPNKTFNLNATVKHNGATIGAVIRWSSDNPSVATVDDKGKIYTWDKGIAHIKASYSSLFEECTVVVGEESDIVHEYVDLGLSVKWATYNVGAISEEELGDYYSWGDVKTRRTSMASYIWCKGDEYSYTKYCNNSDYGYNGFVDNKTVLDEEDDAAHVLWGGDWRMPSGDEFKELVDNCTWKWTTINNVKGYSITSNIEGYTDESIFFPCTGYVFGDLLFNSNEGHYWARTIDTEKYIKGLGAPEHLYFSIESHSAGWNSYRYQGAAIRPVCP